VAEVHLQQEAAFENLQEVMDLNLSLSLPPPASDSSGIGQQSTSSSMELQGAVSATLQPVEVIHGFQLNQEDLLMEDENMVLAQDLNVLVHPEMEEEPPASL
jgi:hypothetical protein